MIKPVLVGEANPYGSRPEYALYPEPERASGDRLCRLVMGLTHDEYLDHFERVNLCPRDWSMLVARQRVTELMEKYDPAAVFVLLGAKVTRAFGLEYTPFTTETIGVKARRVVILPHPSGLNRAWNEPGSTLRARNLLKLNGVMPPPRQPVLE